MIEKHFKTLLLISILLISTESFACSVYPEKFYTSFDSLISNTDSIVVAKLVGANVKKHENIFTFEIVDNLKGESLSEYVLSVPNKYLGIINAKESHESPYFWTHFKGGSVVQSDCNIYPNFLLGYSYLIFKSKERSSLVSTELLLNSHDKWLRYVKEKIANTELSPIYDKDEFLAHFNNVSIFECPLRNSGKIKPKQIQIIKGNIIEKTIFPSYENSKCGIEKERFLYLNIDENNPAYTVKIFDNYADLNAISNGIELLKDNKLKIMD